MMEWTYWAIDHIEQERRARLWRAQHRALVRATWLTVAGLTAIGIWAAVVTVGAFMWQLAH